jgi:hypothetical protein
VIETSYISGNDQLRITEAATGRWPPITRNQASGEPALSRRAAAPDRNDMVVTTTHT